MLKFANSMISLLNVKFYLLFTNIARDVWKKKYFDEKKRTQPLEDQTGKMRAELDNLHKRIMTQLEGNKSDRRHEDQKPGAMVGLPMFNIEVSIIYLLYRFSQHHTLVLSEMFPSSFVTVNYISLFVTPSEPPFYFAPLFT